MQVYRLPLEFESLVVVGDRVHLKPLLSLFFGDRYFYLLALSQNQVRFFQATGSLLHKYRRLIHWRQQQPALNWGSLQLLNLAEERLVGFIRDCDDQRLLCLFNLSPETVYQDMTCFPKCVPTGETGFSDRTYHDTLEIPPFGVFFGNLQRP